MVRFSVQHPKIVIAAVIIMVLALGSQIPRLEINPEVKSMFPSSHPEIKKLDDLENLFGGTETVLIAVRSSDIFTPRALGIIRELTYDVEGLEEVDRTVSLFTVYDIKGSEEGIDIHPLLEEIPWNGEEMERLREKVLSDDMFAGRLVSRDGTTAVVMAILEVNGDDEEVYHAIRGMVERYRLRYPDLEIRFSGMPIARAVISMNMRSDIRKFLPLGAALMLLLLYFSFRTLRGVLLPFGVVVFSVISTFGIMALVGQPFTMVCLLIPVSLLAVANDYGIHIIARYYEEAGSGVGGSVKEVVYRSVRVIGVPIALAGLTTVIGFSSLLTHAMPPARVAGLFACLGITLAFIFSVTFIPAVLSLMRFPKVILRGEQGRFLTAQMRAIGRLSSRYRSLILLFTLALVAVAVTGIPRIAVDTNPVNYFRGGSELVEATELVNGRLAGSVNMSILLEGDVKSPETLERMRRLQDRLRMIPKVGSTLSIVDYLMRLNRAIHGDDPDFYAIPNSRDLVAQYLLLYSMSATPEELDTLVDYDYTKTQITVTLKTNSSAEISDIIDRVKLSIEEEFRGSDLKVEVTGFAVLFKELMSIIVRGQMRSLLLSAVLILIVSAMAFRSVVAGFFCAMPLMVALALVFGMMGYLGMELSITTAMISSVMIGVGVDYTIHFLWRYRSELRSDKGVPEALTETLANSGKAITYNALSVIVGFSVGLISSFLPIYFFCWLITLSILACYLGALILMPAVLGVVRPKFLHGGMKR